MRYRFYVNTQKDEKGRRVGFFGYQQGHELTLAYEGRVPSCFEPTSDITCNITDPDKQICEVLFRLFNETYPHDYRGPSMSVGDVVELIDDAGSRAYAVLNCGFSNKLGDVEGTIKPTPKEWREDTNQVELILTKTNREERLAIRSAFKYGTIVTLSIEDAKKLAEDIQARLQEG